MSHLFHGYSAAFACGASADMPTTGTVIEMKERELNVDELYKLRMELEAYKEEKAFEKVIDFDVIQSRSERGL